MSGRVQHKLNEALASRRSKGELIGLHLKGEAYTDELHRYTGEGWEQEDDVTLVTLQRTPGLA